MTIETIPKRFKFARGVARLSWVLSILFLFYIYYRAEMIFQGSLDWKYFKYYLISLLGIFFWGVVLWLKDEVKLNIVIATISLVGTLYLSEIVLNLTKPFGWNKLEVGPEFDARNRYEVYQDLKSKRVDAVPIVFPAIFIDSKGLAGSEPLFPLAGLSGKTTVVSNENGKYMIYLSDRYGFNNLDSNWNSSQTEWILIGDSFTHGEAVQTGKEIAGQIRSLTEENVINLGMGSIGPLLEFAILKEYAESRKPKIVLWIYYEGNDLRNLKAEKSVPLLMRYLHSDFSQKLIHRQTEINNRLEKYIDESEARIQEHLLAKDKRDEFFWNTRVLRLYNIRQRIGFDKRGGAVDIDPLFAEVLTQARDRVERWGGKLYFIYLPTWSRYANYIQNHDIYIKRGEVIELAKKLNLPVIDIHEELFMDHPDPLSLFPFRNLPHYKAEGYHEIAKVIVSRIKDGR